MKPSEWFKVWIYLLLLVDHQTGKGFFQWEIIQNGCHVTRDQLAECLAFMEEENMIIRKKLPRGVEITVQNWLDYQNKRKPTSTPTSKPTSTPTSEIEQEASNEAEKQDIENLSPPSTPTSKDATTPTIISTIISTNKYNKKDLKIVPKDIANNSQKIQATSKPYLLAKWFYEFRGVNIQPIDIDMRNFKLLLNFYPEEVIKRGILWRLAHDSKGFWIKNITSTGVYKNFGNWFAESMIKAMSFETWLSKNPDLDYRKFEDLLARADGFMRAFNESKKNQLVYFTEKDYGMYRLAIRQKTREAKKEMKEA